MVQQIKASANQKKYQKKQVAKAANIYEEQMQTEVNAKRERLGKAPIKDDDDPPKVERTVSTTDPESGMFVKGEHERQLAYEAHTACDRHGIVLEAEVTAGNVHDSVAWDKVYENTKFVVMDSAYKTPWIAKKVLQDGRIPTLP